MATDQSEDFVPLGTLRNLDALLISPLLELAVAIAIKEGVRQALGGRGSGSGGGRGPRSKIVTGDARVATNRGNKLVTIARLRNGNATLIAPGLQNVSYAWMEKISSYLQFGL